MSNTINRDKLRGIVSDLQKLTGKKVTVTRVLMSKRDCYKAIHELMKLELNIDTKKENETLKRLNKTLNEVNCEVNQDREELRKENVELLNKVKYLENKKSYYCNRFVNEMKENLKNKDKMKKHSLMFKVLYSIIVILGAINVWNLF